MAGQYLFGPKAIADALKNDVRIHVIYKGKTNRIPEELGKLCAKKEIAIIGKEAAFFDQFDHVNHQFLVGFCGSVHLLPVNAALQKLQRQPGLVLIIDSVEDVRNFGSILRSAAAYDCQMVFFRQHHQAPINDAVIRISMGAATYLNLCQVNNLSNLVDKLKEDGFWIYAAVLNERAQSLYQENFPFKTALIVGNEGKGIRNHLVDHADQAIYIPMGGQIQSLNVSVACGICLSYIFEKIKIIKNG